MRFSILGLAGLATVGMALGTAGTLRAQENDRSGRGGDMHFAREAASGGMLEVELGRMAAQRARNPDVKQFGQRMVDDHGKANHELMRVLDRKGMQVPKQLNEKDRATLDRLSRLSGVDFDRQYMTMMVRDHRHDVHAF